MLKFVLIYLIGISFTFAPLSQAKGEISPIPEFEMCEDAGQIPGEIVNRLLRIAETEWGISFDDLLTDYNNGLLVITQITDDTYELYHPSATGTLTILLEADAGGKTH